MIRSSGSLIRPSAATVLPCIGNAFDRLAQALAPATADGLIDAGIQTGAMS